MGKSLASGNSARKDEPRLGLVLLAAGRGSRMERPKQLLPWGEGTVVGEAFANALAAPVYAVVVVTGAHGDPVREAVTAAATHAERMSRPMPAWQVLQNHEWEAGMSTSLRTGVQALPAGLDGFFVALGDMPLIPPAVYASLATAFAGETAIWLPTYEGRRGHPVLVPERHRLAALGQEGDVGLRQVIRANPSDVRELTVPAEGVVIDLDTWDEYVRRRPQ